MVVVYLSTELYSKDVHFLLELIQNAEDNEYEDGVEPSLGFLLTSKYITRTAAPMTLIVFNNEKGFSRRNMDSICSIGDSSKTGYMRRGYIGEKDYKKQWSKSIHCILEEKDTCISETATSHENLVCCMCF